MKVIEVKPDTNQNFSINTPCVFLAGPCTGTRDWHAEVIEWFKQNKSDEIINIFNPCNTSFISVEKQADWETLHLNYAFNNGLICFYLANQEIYDKNRGYARTSRFELGEWCAKYLLSNPRNKNKITIAIEQNFEGSEYIRHRLIKNYGIPLIHNDIHNFCQDIFNKLFLEEPRHVLVDIDNTICITNGTDYMNSKPIYENIDIINQYYDMGASITYWTSRGVKSKINYRELTEKQLQLWGCRYHKLKLDKPTYDIFIDDKAIDANTFFNEKYNRPL